MLDNNITKSIKLKLVASAHIIILMQAMFGWNYCLLRKVGGRCLII